MNAPHNFHSGSNPETHTLAPRYGQILLHWDAPEHEPLELGPKARLVVTTLLIIIIAWALYTNSPLMAITFILVGMTGYLALSHEPRTLLFYITSRGIVAGKEFYEFEDIESFHLYDEPPFDNLLSIKTNGNLVSHVHIPITTLPVRELYDTLVQFVPEDKHEPGLVDTLEKLLHI
ncbi:MAG: hypothetical protein Q8O53_03335 [Candidatus Moranbacteria bacterium]|nr:hypothetical protein [Candidatus Moranbacteria bacterium]